jgi:predicted DNA-binding transcriptional regulator YafY
MPKNSSKSIQQRTARLLGILRSDDFFTTGELAQTLEVSQRTLMRDIEELKLQGYPIESDRGRGGGTRLAGRWGIEKINFSNREAVTLLLSLSITEALSQQGNGFGVKAIKQKITNTFPESQRKQISDLRKRILIGNHASEYISITKGKISEDIWNCVLFSFFESKCLQLTYEDHHFKITRRKFEPQYLLLAWPIWYILGWDFLRNEVRSLRIDRIKSITKLSEHIARRPKNLFENSKEFFHEL